MSPATLAKALAVNRILFGLGFTATPTAGVRGWIGGRAARRPQARVLTRGLGARDIALGAGALWALQRGETDSARVWMAGQAIADGTDLVATWRARHDLPAPAVALALSVAGTSTAIALWSALQLQGGEDDEVTG